MSNYQYTLVAEEGPLKGRHFVVTFAGLKLGRSSQCDIAITDLLLSRSHCRFELRGEDLWLIDLASANQTLVNGAPADEQRLAPGDRVQAGQTTLRVERVDIATATLGDQPAPPAAGAEVIVDLGFGREEPSAAQTKRNFLRPVLWSVAAILVLAGGTTMILDPAGRARAKAKPQSLAADKDKRLLLRYEKVEASAESIFRYEMALSPGGVLTVKIDDLAGKDRHVRKEKAVDPALIAELAHDIETSGFFSLDKSYSGFPPNANTLNEWTLTAVVGMKAHTCRVANRTEPDSFRALREKLETFGKNELGIWAIQFSSDKLTQLAKDALSVAKKKFDEREVKYGNLFDSMRSFQEAVFYLDTVNPKPDFYAEIMDGYEAAENELDKRYKDQNFRADRALNLSDWPTAARELKILCELIPDRADERHKEATRKLLDVESRLKKERR
jgi:hypothetical protein